MLLLFKYFINAGDTKTTGADVVLNYRNIEMGEGKLHASFAANFNKTTIDAINTPKVLTIAMLVMTSLTDKNKG